jgi:hypothetical protein
VVAGVEKVLTKNRSAYVAIVDARKLDYYHALEAEHSRLVMLDDAESRTGIYWGSANAKILRAIATTSSSLSTCTGARSNRSPRTTPIAAPRRVSTTSSRASSVTPVRTKIVSTSLRGYGPIGWTCFKARAARSQNVSPTNCGSTDPLQTGGDCKPCFKYWPTCKVTVVPVTAGDTSQGFCGQSSRRHHHCRQPPTRRPHAERPCLQCSR